MDYRHSIHGNNGISRRSEQCTASDLEHYRSLRSVGTRNGKWFLQVVRARFRSLMEGSNGDFPFHPGGCVLLRNPLVKSHIGSCLQETEGYANGIENSKVLVM